MNPALVLAKGLLYLGLTLLIGGIFARRFLTPAHPGRRVLSLGLMLLGLGVWLTVRGTLAAVGFTAPADVLDYLTLTPPGRALTTLLLGACALLAAELSAWRPAALGLGAALTLWGLAGVGHGILHGPTVRLLHAVHAGAMCVWVGGVLALATLRGAGSNHAARFTPIATACVLTLVVTGSFATLEHTGRLWGVWESGYGRVLLLKLSVVGLALLTALLTRRAFRVQRHIRAFLALEVALLVAVLGVTAALSGTPPPITHTMKSMEMDGH